jgi:SAM-dependent methyltransferase
MHLPTIIRKAVFLVSGRLLLSDALRNKVYQWAWSGLASLPHGAGIIDIGSRDSLFPLFLAWRRFAVLIVERDARFIARERRYAQRWGVTVPMDNCDFLAAEVPGSPDAVCSLFSLQHAGDGDVDGYRKAARLLKAGGLFLSATEYRHAGTRFQHDRDDGSMRIYGPEDIDLRIVDPLSGEGMAECDRRYLAVRRAGHFVSVNCAPADASVLLLMFRKN